MEPIDLARPPNRSASSPKSPNSPGLRRESTDWSKPLRLPTTPTNATCGPRTGEMTPEAEAWAQLVSDDDGLGRNQARSASAPGAQQEDSSNEHTPPPPPPPPRVRPTHPNKAKEGSRRTLLIPEQDYLPPVESSPIHLRRGPSFPLYTSAPKPPGRLQSRLSWTLSDRSEDPAQLGAQLEIGPAEPVVNEEEGLLSLLEEDALMSLVRLTLTLALALTLTLTLTLTLYLTLTTTLTLTLTR